MYGSNSSGRPDRTTTSRALESTIRGSDLTRSTNELNSRVRSESGPGKLPGRSRTGSPSMAITKGRAAASAKTGRIARAFETADRLTRLHRQSVASKEVLAANSIQ